MFEDFTTTHAIMTFGAAVALLMIWRYSGGSWLRNRNSGVNTSDASYRETRGPVTKETVLAGPQAGTAIRLDDNLPHRRQARKPYAERIGEDDGLDDVALIMAAAVLSSDDGPAEPRYEEPTREAFEPSKVEYSQAPAYDGGSSYDSDDSSGGDD